MLELLTLSYGVIMLNYVVTIVEGGLMTFVIRMVVLVMRVRPVRVIEEVVRVEKGI